MTSTQVETTRDINIERTVDIDGIASKIIGKLESVPPQIQKRSYIYRVPRKFREGNERAYEPNLVSIGPYHRRNSNLQNMEFHKLRFLKQLTKRVEEKDSILMEDQMKRYLEELKGLEEEARAFYAEVIYLEQGDFLEMLLLDGCFIIEFLRGWLQQEGSDPLFQGTWTLDTLCHDLLLFENQLPFSILAKLYVLTSGKSLPQLYRDAATLPIHHFILPPDLDGKEQLSIMMRVSSHVCGTDPLDETSLTDIKHLLELVYKYMFIEDTLVKPKTIGLSIKAEELQARLSITKNKYSITDLGDSGIVFKRVERKNFYDIALKSQTLEIPAIFITGKTDTVFRNLIAYEGNGGPSERKYISDYVVFMDNLISSAKDVELLRLKGIIEHYLGDDEAVSTMFNKIGINTVASFEYHYVDIVTGLNEHSQRKWNEWKTTFRRNYLNSPWTIISVIAAVVLLILTALQTLYGVLSYYTIP